MNSVFRALPSTDACLKALHDFQPSQALLPDDSGPDSSNSLASIAQAPRPLLRALVTAFCDARRQDIKAGRITAPEDLCLEALFPALLAFTLKGLRPRLRRVINGTGVVIHTNMGRSVLAPEAREAIQATCAGYCNLELDLETGERGSRYSLVRDLLCDITGAEAAIVVNNNAAAVFLTLNSLCQGREVIVSRGQLVEIGGSFRIPDVMEKSGALLREVGATNRTHARDYSAAVSDQSSAFLRVHTSNFRVVGFHKEVRLPELVALGRAHGLLVIEDLGSGSFMDFSPWGLPGEPTVQSIVAEGADVVLFSGDKVLGGPQAGIIVGKKACIERIRTNPLNRALRPDKMTLAALEATLRLYLDPEEARRRIPTLRMMTASKEELADRAHHLCTFLRSHKNQRLGEALDIRLKADSSRVGGGAFPEYTLPTTLVCCTPLVPLTAPEAGDAPNTEDTEDMAGAKVCSATVLRQRLLATHPPVMGRMEDKAFCLDVRTLSEAEYAPLASALAEALQLS